MGSIELNSVSKDAQKSMTIGDKLMYRVKELAEEQRSQKL